MGFMTITEKQILGRLIGSKTKFGGSHAFLKDNQAIISLKSAKI